MPARAGMTPYAVNIYIYIIYNYINYIYTRFIFDDTDVEGKNSLGQELVTEEI